MPMTPITTRHSTVFVFALLLITACSSQHYAVPDEQTISGTEEKSESRSDEDLRNERFPSTLEQREQHWQVDCSRLRRYLMHAPAGYLKLSNLVQFREELTQCGVIHNTPGTPAADDCPNYAAVSRKITAAIAAGEQRLRRADVTTLLGCSP